MVEIYEHGAVFMIEICDQHGRTLDTPFVKEEDIAEVTYYAE